MDVKTTIPITEARKRIFEVAKAVQQPGMRYTLTDRGRPKVVLMSAEDYESWQETLAVMHEFPDLKKDIAQAERDLTSGRYLKYRTIDELMAELKQKQMKVHGHAVHRSPKTNRRTRAR